MTEKLDRLLSEREDLLDQLKKQESVMVAFRRSLEQIKIQNAQYLKTVNMLQKEIKGWFTFGTHHLQNVSILYCELLLDF